MPDDIIGFDIDDAGVTSFLKDLKALGNPRQTVSQSLLAGALTLERAAKEKLKELVYDEPETWYRRGFGAGLFGATQATNKIVFAGDQLTTGVRTNKDYAKYVMFGTGIYAADGKGRKTPWVYEDDEGKFHWTVGQRPKPYLTLAGQKAKGDILNIIFKSFRR